MTLREIIERYVPSCEQEREDRRMMLEYMDTFPNVLTRENEVCHFTGSSWIVNPARTKALLLYHNIYNSWAWSGGHADGEADMLAVALREAQEETGVGRIQPVTRELYSLEILPVNAHFKRGRYVVPHLHLNLTYLLEADDAQAVHEKPDENSAVRWFPIADAPEASSEPDMRIIYRKLNEKLRNY